MIFENWFPFLLHSHSDSAVPIEVVKGLAVLISTWLQSHLVEFSQIFFVAGQYWPVRCAEWGCWVVKSQVQCAGGSAPASPALLLEQLRSRAELFLTVFRPGERRGAAVSNTRLGNTGQQRLGWQEGWWEEGYFLIVLRLSWSWSAAILFVIIKLT